MRPSSVLRTLLTVLGAATLVAASVALPGTWEATVRSNPVPPATGATTAPITSAELACPGPQTEGLAAAPAVTGVTTVLAAAPPREALGFAPASGGSVGLVAVPGDRTIARTTLRGRVRASVVTGASSVVVTGVGPMSPGLVAAQTRLSPTGDDRALALVACTPPAADIWLVAGGAQASRRERLVLTNPGGNPVTADIEVHGVRGRLPSLGGSGVVVPPRSRVVLLLDAVAAQEAAPVVHVTATGGEVGAVLHDTLIQAAVGLGGDDAQPSAAPSAVQVIPLVPTTGTASLRIAVPGPADAVVQVRLLAASGAVSLPGRGVQRVRGASTADFDLGAVPAGTYAIAVTSDRPALAGVITSRLSGTESSGDLAWSESAPAVTRLAGLPLSADPAGLSSGLLALSSPGVPAQARVVTVAPSGRTVTKVVAVAADSVATVDLTGASAVWVSPTAGTVYVGVLAAVKGASPPLYAVTALRDTAVETARLPVRDLTR